MKTRYRTPNGSVQFTLARALMQNRPSVEVNANATSLEEIVPEDDEQLRHIMADAEWAFDQIKDRPVWAATLSGGKDSTATVCLAIEYLKRHPEVRPRLVILHADTLMEAPPMEEFARSLMTDSMAEECRKHGINCEVRITVPPLEDDFWVMTLGYGYPPFNHSFRPCTTRMKTKPNAKALIEAVAEWSPNHQTPGDMIALLLGVRMDESDARREGLKKICDLTDGECGQILDAPEHIPGDIITVAPIINAKTCKVWDLNMFILPALGWPVERLAEIYGDDVVRFGCWMCSLVTKVKDVENLMQVPEYAWMEHLWRYRHDYLAEAEKDENRLFMTLADKETQLERRREKLRERIDKVNENVLRLVEREKDTAKVLARRDKLQIELDAVIMRKITTGEKGVKRGVKLDFRRLWLGNLLALEVQVGRQLIRPEATEFIYKLWEIEETTGRRGKSGRAAGK